MTHKNLLKHPVIKNIGRIINVAALILLATHGMYAWQAHTTAQNWEERVFIIERTWQFRLLNPAIGNAIGFTLPYLSIGYVNREAIERLGVDIEPVRRHEAKHLQQANQLGLLQFWRLDEWKREGMAEYVRGEPTVSLCSPNPEEDPNRLAYREFYIVTRYLIEKKGLTEEDLYEFEGYPLEEAEKWLVRTHCSQN